MNADLLADLQELDESNESADVATNQLREQYMVEASSVSTLLNDPKFIGHLRVVDELINRKLQVNSLSISEEQYQLIIKSNEYIAIINREIAAIVKFIKGIYGKKLPELENIVTNEVDYAACVAEIESNPQPKFSNLSPHQSISLAIVMSTPHTKLSDKQAQQIQQSTKAVLYLKEHKNVLMMYVESCMHVVAPNLCRLVGSSVASKLMSTAGGIDKLAVMPACNIQVLGSEKTPNLGIGMMGRNHMGFFGSMKMVKDAPNKHQIQLVRMLSTNVAKCARVDALRTCPSGNEGDKIREQLLERFEKIQEPGQSCLDKALPIPDEQPKKRRGGKRHRKRKEAMGMTEVNKYKNRMKFGEEEEENVDGMAMGMLGNMGKVRVNIKKTQKINPSKKLMEQLKKSNQSGMESSLAFASVQGIELMNPSNINLKKGTDTYFNRQSGFKTVLEEKMKRMQ